MKGWKRFSIYHAIKKRRERQFSEDTIINFFVVLNQDSNFYLPIVIITTVIATSLAFYLNLGLMGWLLLDLVLYGTTATILAIFDTYYTYKYRLRQNTITSLYKMMEIEVNHWGNPVKKKKVKR
jgi:hypothetical protein